MDIRYANQLVTVVELGYSLSLRPASDDYRVYKDPKGQVYVAMDYGVDFSLIVQAPTQSMVVLAVDQRNVIDSTQCSGRATERGYLLESGQKCEIPGWLISGQQARKFYLAKPGESYVEKMGYPHNELGTIGARFFGKQVDYARLYSSPYQFGDSLGGGNLKGGCGTGMGEATDFRTQSARFDPNPNPSATLQLRVISTAEVSKYVGLTLVHPLTLPPCSEVSPFCQDTAAFCLQP